MSENPGKIPAVSKQTVITLLACIACIVIFVGLNLSNLNSWETWERWGSVRATNIWGGKYWGALTSVFVHVQLLHVAFNVCWLWAFGSRIESHIGSARYLLFFAFAGIVSSGAQLGVSGETGIGASGVGYALFGFMWVTRRNVPEFEAALTPNMIWLGVAWFVGCIVVTQIGAMDIGNTAHAAGLLFGAGVGACFVLNYKKALVLPALIAFSTAALVPLFWAPWTHTWAIKKAYDFALAHDEASAIYWYKRCIKIGESKEKEWALSNVIYLYIKNGSEEEYNAALLELRQLNAAEAKKAEIQWWHKKGYELHLRKDYAGAIELYRRSLDMDPAQPIIWENLAGAYAATGRYEDMKLALAQLRALDPAKAKKFEEQMKMAPEAKD